MKRIISLLIVLVVSIAIPLNVFAKTPDAGIKTLYTESFSSTLLMSGNTATCKSSLTGYKGETTQIVIGQYLQKKNSSGNWTTVKSASTTINYYKGSFTKTYSGLSSGTYRLKSSFVVYAGSNFETLMMYSNEKTI